MDDSLTEPPVACRSVSHSSSIPAFAPSPHLAGGSACASIHSLQNSWPITCMVQAEPGRPLRWSRIACHFRARELLAMNFMCVPGRASVRRCRLPLALSPRSPLTASVNTADDIVANAHPTRAGWREWRSFTAPSTNGSNPTGRHSDMTFAERCEHRTHTHEHRFIVSDDCHSLGKVPQPPGPAFKSFAGDGSGNHHRH